MILIPAAAAQMVPSHLAPSQDRVELDGTAGSAVDSSAITKEGLPGNVSELSATDAQATSAGPAAEDEYQLAEEIATAPPIQAIHYQWQPEAAPHIPSAEWTSDSTNRTRQYLLVGFLGLTGITLAIVAFLGFLRWHADSPTPARPPQADGSLQSAPAGHDDPTLAAALVNNSSLPKARPLQSDGIGGNGLDSAGPPVAREAAPPRTSAPGTAEDNLHQQAAPDRAPDSQVDGPTNISASPPIATEPDQPETGPSLPKQLAAFAPMLQYEIQPQFPDAIEIRSEAPVTAEDLGLTSAAGLPEIPPVDLAVQSQVKISALVMAPLPLAQFVSLWSNVSGVPTVVDIDSLSAAAIDRNQNLSLELVQSTTVGDLIPRLGQAVGLQPQFKDNRFVQLAAPVEAIEQKLPAALSLEGLLSGAEGEAAWLQSSLPQLFPEQACEWNITAGQLQRPLAADGSGPLDAAAWFAVVRLIEGWRMASGGEKSLSQYTSAQLSAEFVEPAEVSGLEFIVQEVTPQARPVAQILPRVCQEAGVHAWIDWANVAMVGLGPQTTAVFVTSARPLKRVLADYASEFSLVITILDRQSLWLTSQSAYRSSPQVYVFPSSGKTPEEWQAQLRPLTPTAPGGPGVGSVVVIPTPDEKFVLVRCCRPTVTF